MQPHGEQHNGSPNGFNLAPWSWRLLPANGRQWRTPWADQMVGAWQPLTPWYSNNKYSYDLTSYSQYHIDMIYIVTTNPNLLYSISLQPIIHHYDLLRYSQYYTPISSQSQPIQHSYKLSSYSQYYNNMTHPVIANTTLLWLPSIQPTLICYNLSRYNQSYIDVLLIHLMQPVLNWLSIPLQLIIHCYNLFRTAKTTLLWSISSQPTPYRYDLSRYH